MNTFLMHKDRDFDLQRPLPLHHKPLAQDLELNILFNAMARGDQFLLDIAQKALLCGTDDLETIRYRQDILKDCLKNPAIIREMYQIPIDSGENKKLRWMGFFTRYPGGILKNAIEMMELFVGLLRHLRAIADEHFGKFESEGFRTFFTMIQKELDDEYFTTIEEHLKELKFRDGVLLSATLGRGNEGENYVLRKPLEKQRSWIKDIFTFNDPVYTFYVSDRDEAGCRVLGEIKDRGLNLAANALAQSADHIDNFFIKLRVDLAFYVGCLNLYEELVQLQVPICFPTPLPLNERQHSFRGLYDVCLALTMKRKVVGNELVANGKDLVIITGANQGGKSTFLRSIGVSQLMMQAGMFVPAEEFSANLCQHVFTHYKREEDTTMKSGKLDEELKRMSEIVDLVAPNALVLFNESFAATNEREGSEIARQITNALLERRIKVFFVTHLFEFAHAYYENQPGIAVFLRAERKAGGKRTFKLFEGEPLQTSYGEDIYQAVFHPGG